MADDPKPAFPLVPVSAEPGLPSLFEKVTEEQRAQFVSFIPQTEAEQALVYNATESACTDLDLVMDKELYIRGLLLHYVELSGSMDSEPRRAVRCVLLGSKGERWESVSDGIFASAKRLVMRKGLGPWEPGLRVIPRKVQTSQKRYIHKLEWIVDGKESANAKKSK